MEKILKEYITEISPYLFAELGTAPPEAEFLMVT